ncbi:MAG: metal-dependent hydrolase [Deltaproteobacteria bacterium]|nr:MAG: metal-dependent hydrolase [Deltaproteobacteria bacterium]
MERFIISSETVLPISSPPIIKGSVFVDKGKIEDVGSTEELLRKYRDIKRIDLGRGILLPGFINAHVHLELGWITKKIKRSGGFGLWLGQVIKALREERTEEEIEASVRDGINELIESGVTTVGEISSFGLDRYPLKESGLRAVLFVELFDRHKDFWNLFGFEKNEVFEERPFPHAPYSCSPEFLKTVIDFSRKNHIPIGIHLAESREEVKFIRGEKNVFEAKIFPMVGREVFQRSKAPSPFGYLKALGFFNETKVTAVHMVHISKEEASEIPDYSIGVVMCPRSNLFLGVGLPPVLQYRGYERIGIGTDGLSSNLNLNIFEELRSFYLLFSKRLGQRASFLTVYLATLGGARALFLEDRIGSIEKGKEADLIFLKPRYTFSDPYLSVISSCKEDLKLVMVRGREIHSKPR